MTPAQSPSNPALTQRKNSHIPLAVSSPRLGGAMFHSLLLEIYNHRIRHKNWGKREAMSSAPVDRSRAPRDASHDTSCWSIHSTNGLEYLNARVWVPSSPAIVLQHGNLLIHPWGPDLQHDIPPKRTLRVHYLRTRRAVVPVLHRQNHQQIDQLITPTAPATSAEVHCIEIGSCRHQPTRTVNLAGAPAPDSTATLKPALVSEATLAGDNATRFSPSSVSFGTPGSRRKEKRVKIFVGGVTRRSSYILPHRCAPKLKHTHRSRRIIKNRIFASCRT